METLVGRFIQRAKYDNVNDILYIDFKNNRGNSYADDGPFGIEIMRDMDTDDIVGLLIFYPLKEMKDRQNKLNSLGYNISLKRYVSVKKKNKVC